MKLGSLFDGIAGFPLAASRLGITSVWASEIDKSAIAVTKKHFPDMIHLGDITKINGAAIEPVDIIAFGAPCQDWSVAGKRAGIEGARSGLFFEAVRIISEMQAATCSEYPKFLVFENVPGLLSANKGADIQIVLDSLQGLGFVVDMNVLDAQHMGVPQRRKRVFIVCVSVGFILTQRTTLSANTIGQLLTKILLDILRVHSLVSENAQKNLDCLDRLRDGLQKKMSLFGITTLGNLLTLQSTWEEIIQKHQGEQKNLDYPSKGLVTMNTVGDIPLSASPTRTADENQFLSTSKLWRRIWEEVLWGQSLSITSTATSETTNFGIYTCALINLHMVKHIVPLKNCCPNLSEMVLSTLTVMKECINYAKQARRSLSKELEWVERWDNYIHTASDCVEQIERNFRGQSAPEILFECESNAGDFTESRSAWKEVAASVGDGVESTRTDYLTGWDSQEKRVFTDEGISPTLAEADGGGGRTCCGYILSKSPVVTAKWAKGSGGPSGDECQNLVVVKNAVTAYALQGNMIGRQDKNGPQGDGINEDISFTLNTTDRHAVAYQTLYENHGQDRIGGWVEREDRIFAFQSDTKRSTVQEHIYHKPVGVADSLTQQKQHVIYSRAFEGDIVRTLTARQDSSPCVDRGQDLVFTSPSFGQYVEGVGTLRASGGDLGGGSENLLCQRHTVRRLTPIECERLMGFPDNWTAGHSDSAKYRMLGNSIAVPCAEYIFNRLVNL